MSLRSVAISFLLILSINLWGDDEIRVELRAGGELASTYVSKIRGDESNLRREYLSRLRKILYFDLNYSGHAKVMKIDEILEKALGHNDVNVAFNPSRWSKGGVQYVFKPEVVGNTLSVFAFDVEAESLKQFDNITLSGDLSRDRKQIHLLSNAILSSLFGKEGVAHTRLLYSVQAEKAVPGAPNKWLSEIWSCDWDGGNARQITYEEDYSITPVFIPPHPTYGSDRFLYVNYKNGQPKIFLSSIKSKAGKPLLELRGNQLLPAISKQRNQIAFISDATGRADLFVQEISPNGRLKGKPKQLFSYPRATQASPTFSPNGQQIAFVSDKGGTPRIYIIPSYNEDNKRADPKLITKKNRENTCPIWSPDGKKLAYSAKTNGVRQIWIYDFELEEEQQLTAGPGNKENPCWGPDSLHLVFNSTDPGSSQLFLVNLNQKDAVQITSGPNKKHYPTWGIK